MEVKRYILLFFDKLLYIYAINLIHNPTVVDRNGSRLYPLGESSCKFDGSNRGIVILGTIISNPKVSLTALYVKISNIWLIKKCRVSDQRPKKKSHP